MSQCYKGAAAVLAAAALLAPALGHGAGAAAAAYVRLGMDGQALGKGQHKSWGCTIDSARGLTWEVKSDDQGLGDARWTYWPHPGDEAADERIIGYRGDSGGHCARAQMAGKSCDTAAYVQAVNTARLCGHTDWRLPTVYELLAFSHDYAALSAAQRERVFPRVVPGWYWTSTIEHGGVPYTRVTLLPPRASPVVFDGTYAVLLVRGSAKPAKPEP